MWHLQLRAGMRYPDDPAPGPAVPFETALVTLGKESGKLEECLRLLGDYFAAEDRMILKLIAKATYPVFLMLVGCVLLPFKLAIDGRVGAYAATALGGLFLVTMLGGSAMMLTLKRYLNQPKYVLGRLLRALTFAIEAGLPVGRSALLAAEATGNAEVIAHVRRQRGAISQSLKATFTGCPHVPAQALAAMEVAEASGDYTHTLKKMAELVGG